MGNAGTILDGLYLLHMAHIHRNTGVSWMFDTMSNSGIVHAFTKCRPSTSGMWVHSTKHLAVAAILDMTDDKGILHTLTQRRASTSWIWAALPISALPALTFSTLSPSSSFCSFISAEMKLPLRTSFHYKPDYTLDMYMVHCSSLFSSSKH